MKPHRRKSASKVLALVMASVVGVLAGAGTAAADIPVYTHPGLEQARVITTNPIAGSTVKPKDAEGMATCPQDHSIWLADDSAHALYEINADTGAYKRTITQAQLAAAVRLGGSETAGNSTAFDLEAMTYDQDHDALYVFSGPCCTSAIRAAAFRLERDAQGVFQVESFQPFTAPLNDFSGVGTRQRRAVDRARQGHLQVRLRQQHLQQQLHRARHLREDRRHWGLGRLGPTCGWSTARTRCTASTGRPGRSSPTTRSTWPRTASRTPGPSTWWVTSCSSGTATTATPPAHPTATRSRCYNVVDLDASLPPTASFTTTTTSGAAPLTVQFTDTSAPNPTSWSWNFGDGGSSTAQHPSHQYTQTGSFTATLTATNANGSTTASTSVTVTGPQTVFTVAKDSFVNSGSANSNYGSADYLRALAGSSQYRPYVAFNVSGLGAPVARAVLRLYVTDASNSGGTWHAVNPSWSESAINWNNAPPLEGAALANVGAVTLNTWVEVDVTPAVTGNGTFSFAALTNSTNSLRYASKESANPPQLVITVGGGSSPPLAAFTATPTGGTAPLAVQFTDAVRPRTPPAGTGTSATAGAPTSRARPTPSPVGGRTR